MCLTVSPLLLLPISTDYQGTTPPELWHFDFYSNSYGGAAVGDVDGDGRLEIVFGTYMGDETLYALNAEDGSVAWTYWAGPGPLDASVRLVDINDDGNLEVIFATSGSYTSGAGVMHCLHGCNGTPIWHYNPHTCTDSPPALADIDNDSKLEVLYGTFHDGESGGYVHILNAEDGSLVDIAGPYNGHIQSGPAVVDLDLDGQLDFVITMFGGNDRIYAVNGSDYSTMWNYLTGDSMYHTCSFSNLDDDAFPELVVGNYDGFVYAIHGENGSLYWKYDVTYACYCTSIADVDGDSLPEVIASGTYEVTVINNDGSHLWHRSVFGSFRGAAMADVDGDQGLDVIVGGDDGVLMALDGSSGSTLWSFDAASDYGQTPFQMDHAPVIADFDDDQDLDIFIIGGRGYSGDPENNYGRAYALELSDTSGAGWTMFHHDYCNSGDFDHDTPGQVYGFVADASTGSPIEGALVEIGSKSCVTDQDGVFWISLDCGSYSANVSSDGYQSVSRELAVLAGLLPDSNFTLTPSSAGTTDTGTSTGSATGGTGTGPGILALGGILAGSAAAGAVVTLWYRRRSYD